jgi:acetyl esterase
MERGKYEELIDRETWAFIDRTNEWYPPETTSFPIERQRAIYDAMCRAFHSGYPSGVRARDSLIEAADRLLPIRRCLRSGST